MFFVTFFKKLVPKEIVVVKIEPNIINPSRKRRIASGSGMKVEDVNKLLKQFEQMQKMVKQLKPKATKKGKKKRLLPGLGGLTKF